MLKNSALILSHAKKISFGSLQYRHQSYFGMRGGNLDNVNQDVDKIAQVIDQSQSIVVMAGAGLSTASGIPDFRS